MGDGLPWFPFYVRDWLLDEKVLGMTFAERGVYLHLLCLQWLEGSIATPVATLKRALGLASTTLGDDPDLEAILVSCFPAHPTIKNRRANPRLLKVQEQQRVAREAMIQGGRKGGLKGGFKAPSTEPEPESELTTPIHTGDPDSIREHIPVAYLPAYDGYIRSAEKPDWLRMSIAAAAPGGAHVLRGTTWEHLGHALLDMQAASPGRFNAAFLAGCIRRLVEGNNGAPSGRRMSQQARNFAVLDRVLEEERGKP